LSKNNYESLGVSASKSGLHAVLEKTGLSSTGHLFASVTEDIAGDTEYYSFMHCDGAGTKTIVPYLYFRETGDSSLFRGLAQDALVMNLDDVFCVGTPERLCLSNAIARNARIINDEILAEILIGYRDLCGELRNNGIDIELCGGETADCGDIVRTLVVDAVLSGRIKKSQIIDTQAICSSDVIVGLSSTGKASYEKYGNSGIGSNGLTLARHCLLNKTYLENNPEVVDPGIDQKLAYRGPFRASDRPKSLTMSVGHALASPTRTYAPLLIQVYKCLGSDVHAAIHQTGGGQTKILRFGKNKRYIKDNLFPVPPLFQLIQEHGAVSWREMYQVFNMGHRMELYVPEKRAEEVIRIASQFQIDARVVGRVENQDASKAENTNSLLLKTPYGEFDFEQG